MYYTNLDLNIGNCRYRFELLNRTYLMSFVLLILPYLVSNLALDIKLSEQMKIEHIAIWTKQLEVLKRFYEDYFGATNSKYHNPAKGFLFIFPFATGSRQRSWKWTRFLNRKMTLRSIYRLHSYGDSLGSEKAVDELTNRLVEDGYERLDGPRRTGDGYYESCVLILMVIDWNLPFNVET